MVLFMVSVMTTMRWESSAAWESDVRPRRSKRGSTGPAV
jgi:hypothetical protein